MEIMQVTRNLRISGVLSFLLLVFVIDNAHADVRERIGYAYDKQSGRFLYSESHREVLENGRVLKNTIAYKDDEGNLFAEKHIDFKKSLVMPDFYLVNTETGHAEGARGSEGDNRLEVHFRQLSDVTVQKAYVETPLNGIIDAGFDRFIEQNWTALVGGEVLERQFLIPSQLDFYTFEIRKAEAERKGEFAFQLGVKSIFLQMFVSPVLVYYDAQTRSLLRYEGVSNIRNSDGENFDVRIEFQAPGGTRVGVRPVNTVPRRLTRI